VIAERISEQFAKSGYIANPELATALELALALEKPLLIEGPAGVGKTDSAKVLADVLDARLIRLQCYEGLDSATALYEWNYPKQLLRIRLTENQDISVEAREAQIFSEQFLLRRPLLDAIAQERAPVLLIDDSRSRHDPREASPGRDPDVEPFPRTIRCLAPALLVPLVELPEPRAGDNDPTRALAGHRRAPRRTDRAVHGVLTRAAVSKSAGHSRELGLGESAHAVASQFAR